MQAAVQGKQLSEALAAASEAAARGNEAARMMKSQHGKAAVYRNQTIGKEDPGASVGVLIVQGFAKVIENHA